MTEACHKCDGLNEIFFSHWPCMYLPSWLFVSFFLYLFFRQKKKWHDTLIPAKTAYLIWYIVLFSKSWVGSYKSLRLHKYFCEDFIFCFDVKEREITILTKKERKRTMENFSISRTCHVRHVLVLMTVRWVHPTTATSLKIHPPYPLSPNISTLSTEAAQHPNLH